MIAALRVQVAQMQMEPRVGGLKLNGFVEITRRRPKQFTRLPVQLPLTHVGLGNSDQHGDVVLIKQRGLPKASESVVVHRRLHNLGQLRRSYGGIVGEAHERRLRHSDELHALLAKPVDRPVRAAQRTPPIPLLQALRVEWLVAARSRGRRLRIRAAAAVQTYGARVSSLLVLGREGSTGRSTGLLVRFPR